MTQLKIRYGNLNNALLVSIPIIYVTTCPRIHLNIRLHFESSCKLIVADLALSPLRIVPRSLSLPAPMNSNWHPDSRPTTAPHVHLDDRSGGPTLRNPNPPATLVDVDLTTQNTEGTTYGTTSPFTATTNWDNQENSVYIFSDLFAERNSACHEDPLTFLTGLHTLANQYSPLDFYSAGEPPIGNCELLFFLLHIACSILPIVASQSVGDVGYRPSNGRIFNQKMSSSETILGEDPNDYVAQYGPTFRFRCFFVLSSIISKVTPL